MERKFKRDVKSLDEIFVFLNEFMTANHLDRAVSLPINLAVEELFTNMLKYNPDNPGDISIAVEKNQSKLTVVLVDFEAKPFDVTKAGEVDVHRPLKDRDAGGLGIHLVTRMVDSFNYEYANGQSKITLTKNLEA